MAIETPVRPEPGLQSSLEEMAKANTEQTLELLHSSSNGLSPEEAAHRLETTGPNAIAAEQRSALTILGQQLRNGLMILLFSAALITIVLGDYVDGAIILVLLLLNTSLGFFQEYRAERALADLRRLVEVQSRVLRGGQEVQVPARDIVPGDIIMVRDGDLVPADARLIDGEGLMVNQAALTGESLWQEKDPAPMSTLPSAIASAPNLLFSGTSVMAGAGRAIVVGTGKRTAFGRTASLLQDVRRASDFQRNLDKFAGFLLRFGLVLTAVVFIANALLGRDILTSLTLSLALALGLVPEALPAVTITSLSLGASILVRNKVVVRRLAAIEDFSAIDVLCTDKTGTITENKVAVTGLGTGGTETDLLRAAILCSDFPVVGRHPIDDAIVQAAKDKGLDLDRLAGVQRLVTLPFTSARKRTSVLVPGEDTGSQTCEIITKGAAAVIIDRCTQLRQGSETVDLAAQRENIEQRMRTAAEAGNMVLAVASKPIPACQQITEADEEGFTLLGFIMLADPLRPGAGDAIKQARELGLDVKIITGDSRYTAIAMARSLGLPSDPSDIVAGEDLRSKDLAEISERAHIFAEVVPEDKYHIVRALQSKGHRVAVTGDGINDSPALKTADVGIAMESGTEVAKDASDLILLENDLRVIVDGLREGRRVFINLNRYLVYTMVSNFANVLIVAVASLFLNFLPLLPEQVLLVSILPDIPMLSIATDRVSRLQVSHPRHWAIRQIMEASIYLGIFNAIFAFGLLRFFQGAPPPEIRTAWYLFIGITSILILFPARSHLPFWKDVAPSWQLTTATAVTLIVVILLAELPLSQVLFGFVPLSVTTQLALFGYSLLYVLVAELVLVEYYRHTVET
ncbi:MAG: cation-transporting P-type ATPase [Chloroflexi bacterium]|nr:cation-transporting P-type ATPase [Chloroflexota bacterium]